jgi:cellulose synthase/poly-beta-1,6-N-acetylglucosamine synthase-like glycosyltransferase
MISAPTRERVVQNNADVRPVKLPALPWGTLIAALILAVVVPSAVYVAIARVHPGFIESLHYAITVIYAVTSTVILMEAVAALRYRSKSGVVELAKELPRCTALVAAYLPNEQSIILDTVRHLQTAIDIPADRFQILLAYNTPFAMEIEETLADIARKDPRITLVKVDDSTTKAGNVNGAIPYITGDIVAIYDADHHPESTCFQKAWRRLCNGADIVQGRCIIRNDRFNWFTRLVAIEFDQMYTVSHQGRSELSGTAIFGGSNGYWRREVLEELRMRPSMLTEDIDSSVRAMLAGYRLVHDRDVVSMELAPQRPKHWFFQRKRWSQGWFEVTLCHFKAVMSSPRLSAGQKLFWFYQLAWREAYPFLSTQIFPLVIAAALLGRHIHWFGNGFFIGAGALNLACGPLLLLTTAACGKRPAEHRLGLWYVVFACTSLIYTTVKTAVIFVGQCSHAIGDRAWISTPRA